MYHHNQMTDLQRALAENLKKFRKVLGLNQMQLAEEARISTGFLAGIETGKKFPSARTLESLGRALKVRTWQLFMDASENSQLDTADLMAHGHELQAKVSRLILEETFLFSQKANSQKGDNQIAAENPENP